MEAILLKNIDNPNSADIGEYKKAGGYKSLEKALAMDPQQIIDEVKKAGLRGRGGAGFPVAMKWTFASADPKFPKYLLCNADEGEPGTFKDRPILEKNPHLLIEGMAISGHALKAEYGYIYLRGEYPAARHILNAAIRQAYDQNLLGENILGKGITFHLAVHQGAGAYICGEETALLESLEGKRGMVRFKPPLPAIQGLFGRPTVVNNVISLATVPIILDRGAAHYRDFGMGRSRGTITIQLGGNVRRGGLIERGFGITLGDVINGYGGGTATGRPVRAVQVGGPLGAYFPGSLFDTPLDYEAFAAEGGMLGHGGIVVFDDTVDLAAQARFAMEFCAIESCGKCTPCRIGSTRGVEVIDRIVADRNRASNIELLTELCDTMLAGSLCALGGLAPYPVLSSLKHFPEDFARSAPERLARV
jgi:formate dehydrogenase iron-sulfur subunit